MVHDITTPRFPLWTAQAEPQWSWLVEGELVDVLRGSRWLNRSHVDALAPDGTVIWLIDVTTGCRTLHLATDGLTIRPCSPWASHLVQ
ncbi:hypothetical protein ABIA52_002351 [Paenarthrobacter histidinolovorans]|uniref:Uncharacterized protein n=1 Tax=Paenarthrobacter histidinolovorans TaxID=43664 RepID=A0ABW8N796_9MICC